MRVCYICADYNGPAFAGLQALHGSEHEVVLVVAYAQTGDWAKVRVPLVDVPLHLAILAVRSAVRAARRFRRAVAYRTGGPVERFCRANGIRVLRNAGGRVSEHAEAIADAEPDVIVASNWPFRIPQSVCRLARVEAVNCHGSLLPAYRGPGATYAALIDGAGEMGITVHVIEPAFDSGAILAQKAVPVGPGDSAAEVGHRRRAAIGGVILEALAVAGERHLYRPNPPSPYYELCATATYLRRRTANRLRRRLGLPIRPYVPSHDYAGCPAQIDRDQDVRSVSGPASTDASNR
jgi:hypothetical protein